MKYRFSIKFGIKWCIAWLYLAKKNFFWDFLPRAKMDQFGFGLEKKLPTENTSATYQVFTAKPLPTQWNKITYNSQDEVIKNQHLAPGLTAKPVRNLIILSNFNNSEAMFIIKCTIIFFSRITILVPRPIQCEFR